MYVQNYKSTFKLSARDQISIQFFGGHIRDIIQSP